MKPELSTLDQITNAAESGDWRAALLLAATYRELGEERDDIQRAASSIRHPYLYQEMGYDPADLIKRGISALKRRYSL